MRRFQLIIIAIDKPGEHPPEVRLRQWLKIGLRAFGLRVESIAPVQDEPTQTSGGQQR